MAYILFECDRKCCLNCNPECFHTGNVEHAKNFVRHKNGNGEFVYVENDPMWSNEMNKNDQVCHPSHYTHDGVETIDKMLIIFGVEELMTICKGNCFKYLDRYMYKGNPLQDLSKAFWYATKYLELLTDKDFDFDIKNKQTTTFVFNLTKNHEYYAHTAKTELIRSTTDDDPIYCAELFERVRTYISKAYTAYEKEHANEK